MGPPNSGMNISKMDQNRMSILVQQKGEATKETEQKITPPKKK